MSKKRILSTIGLGMALLGLTSCFSVPTARYTEQQDWTLDGAGVSVINAQGTNGWISVDGSDQGNVTVYAYKEVRAFTETAAEEFAREIEVHVEQRGNEIQIYNEHPRPPRGVNVSVSYEVRCPRTVSLNSRTTNGKIQIDWIEGTVDAETTNGSIELQGKAGKANLATTNGKIWIHGVEGTVDAETTNGSIELHGGKQNINLRTTNGGIDIEESTGRISAHTTNGKIKASVDRLEDEGVFSSTNGSIDVQILKGIVPITVTTSNASIDLTLPSDFSGQLHARTQHGRVSSEFPISMTVTEIQKTRLVGQIGSGGETTVNLNTTNGSIHLRKQE
jgi:hypothetical protein